MKGDDLPMGGQIVRYVKPSMIQEDGTPSGSDFRLRPNRPDEVGLSINWLEDIGSAKTNQLDNVRRASRLTLKSRGRFAEMNVGTVKLRVAKELDTLRIIHDPLEAEGKFEPDPSHAQIIGLPPGESDQALLVGDLIAECVVAMHPALSGGDG